MLQAMGDKKVLACTVKWPRGNSEERRLGWQSYGTPDTFRFTPVPQFDRLERHRVKGVHHSIIYDSGGTHK